MLGSLGKLIGAPVVTRNGNEKCLRNFLFDDRSWSVRFLVVDVGSWIGRRLVVIPAAAVNEVDWEKQMITIQPTTDQLLRSPDADSQKPVSRQQELALIKEFGWSDYVFDWFISSSVVPAQKDSVVETQEDPHLRGTQDLVGYEVRADDGRLGILEDFVLEPGSWHIKYLIVKIGDWVFRREQFVPASTVTGISWANHSLTVAGKRRFQDYVNPAGSSSWSRIS